MNEKGDKRRARGPSLAFLMNRRAHVRLRRTASSRKRTRYQTLQRSPERKLLCTLLSLCSHALNWPSKEVKPASLNTTKYGLLGS